MIQLLCEIASQPGPENTAAPSSLRFAFFGGDMLTKRDLSSFRSLFPSATCVNFYGATETPQAMGYFVVSQQSANGLRNEVTENVPVGRGIEGVQLIVLTDSAQLAGIDECGEIYIRTPYLAGDILAIPL
jgi:acyl-CoA synthetase (AMP-forming)/AMP-acid ligase II